MREQQGPLATTSSVVRGLTAFSSVITESLNVSICLLVHVLEMFVFVGGCSIAFFDVCSLQGIKYWA